MASSASHFRRKWATGVLGPPQTLLGTKLAGCRGRYANQTISVRHILAVGHHSEGAGRSGQISHAVKPSSFTALQSVRWRALLATRAICVAGDLSPGYQPRQTLVYAWRLLGTFDLPRSAIYCIARLITPHNVFQTFWCVFDVLAKVCLCCLSHLASPLSKLRTRAHRCAVYLPSVWRYPVWGTVMHAFLSGTQLAQLVWWSGDSRCAV